MKRVIPLLLVFFFSCGPSAEEQYRKAKRETDSLDKISAQLTDEILNPSPKADNNKIVSVKDIVVNVKGLSNLDLIKACGQISRDCDNIFTNMIN